MRQSGFLLRTEIGVGRLANPDLCLSCADDGSAVRRPSVSDGASMKHLAMMAALVGIGTCWGATIPLAKIAVSTGHQPMGLIFWQLVISGAALAVVAGWRRAPLPVNGRTLTQYLAIAMLGTLLPNSFSYIAIVHLPAGIMSIVIAMVPMFALTLALGLRLERFSPVRMTGVLLGGAAVVLLIAPQASLPDAAKAVFVIVALAAPFCYALEANYLALRPAAGLDPVATLLGASIIGALIAAPFALAAGDFIDLTRPWGAAEWALAVSSLLHALAYTGYVWLVGVAGPVFSSQIAYVVTAAGVLISAVALREDYSAWVWASLMVMLAGLALVQPRRKAAFAGE
jgi:drug/metabolite transporter (DMT)-like permease